MRDLIDRGCLIARFEEIKDTFISGEDYEDMLDVIKEAEKVETTDDVMGRLPEFVILENYAGKESIGGTAWECVIKDDITHQCENGIGKTPLEAVTRLESSLNPK